MARPANCGDKSDMAAEEHFDVTSLLNLPQWSPPPSPCSSANSMLVYQQWSGQSSMDFVDRSLYIAGDMALTRQKLLQSWMVDDEWGPRGGIMSMNKENLPQSLECLGISLLHLYVEDEIDTLLYWQGESSGEQQREYHLFLLKKLLQVGEFGWVYSCSDLERKDYGQGMFGTERFTMGVWRIGPREWVAKIRYQRHSLESPYYVNERGRYCYSDEVGWRTTQVVFEDARLNFPDLSPDFLHTAVAAAQRKDPGEHVMDYIFRTTPVTDGRRFDYWLIGKAPVLWTANPDEDLDNGEVEPLRIEGERTGEADIAESRNPGPSTKRQRKEKTPIGERVNKKTTRVKNVIPLDKILRVEEMHLKLKDAAEHLKVSRSALKRACREHGINRWPPRNKHEGIMQSLPNETPTVVDQEGIPQLTIDTVPSNQDLTATGDTNSVAEETPPLQFSLTIQQENPDEDYDKDEVEADGLGGVGTGGGEMKRNEVAPGGKRGKCNTGVRIEIALEEILRYKEIYLKDAARELKVGRSTLKRVCRSYNIFRWPPREEHKLISLTHPNESPKVVDQERIPQLNSDTLPPSDQISTASDANSVTVTAKYKKLRIKFQLSWPWRKVGLEQEVKKRLQLDAATYYIIYKDEDDEMTLIGCDEDLEGYISHTTHLGTRSIELFLEPK